MGKIRLGLCGWYSGFRKQSFTLWVLSSVFCFWTRLSHPSRAVHCVDSPYDLCIPHTPIKMKLFPKEATHRYTLALSGWSIKSAWCRAVSQKRWAWTESRRWASERGSPERERNERWAAGGVTVCPIAKRKVRLMRSIKLCQQQELLHKETMGRLTFSNLRPLAWI